MLANTKPVRRRRLAPSPNPLPPEEEGLMRLRTLGSGECTEPPCKLKHAANDDGTGRPVGTRRWMDLSSHHELTTPRPESGAPPVSLRWLPQSGGGCLGGGG